MSLFDTKFSKISAALDQVFNVQHCSMSLIEKWCRSLDAGDHAGALLTGASKAFDCIDRDLLIAKLKAYGLEIASLN